MKNKICLACQSVGAPKKVTQGNFLIEVILWLFMIVPGLIYSIWRLSTKLEVCAACGAQNMVPLTSPAAIILIREATRAKVS